MTENKGPCFSVTAKDTFSFSLLKTCEEYPAGGYSLNKLCPVESMCWTRFILKNCSPQRTPARAVLEGLQPVGRTHVRAGEKREEEEAAERNCHERTTNPFSPLSIQWMLSILGNTDLIHLPNAILPKHFCVQDIFLAALENDYRSLTSKLKFPVNINFYK